ncbi:MAG: Spermidine synthase [uncultured Solirubrobacteraceae bacterium]|uniref:Spermidine synthase n=1 Tax=uncultured Solirubrobacteraceae bacterium TaxID=1162706 RepID=A0A6J4RGE9_9ACTN|nr:MAG: Spermidine synthase [uncultured Solirubrobacteraceae bacterium]
MSDSGYRSATAAGLVFLASGAVLVLEILGIRLLAPYVGLTLETTTTVIGTVLAGIAAGAALGGRLADRVADRRLVGGLLAAGGLLALTTVPLLRLLGGVLQGGGDVAALVITLVALFPCATVLSAVTPTVVKLQLRDLETTGSVVGRLSAWATAGALAGTFATGFVIVPLVATDVAILGVGAALLAVGIAMLVRHGANARKVAAGAAAMALLLVGAAAALGAPCDVESTYHCARIAEDPQNPAGRVLVLDDLQHSYVDLADDTHLEFDYTRWIGDAIDAMASPEEPLAAVFLGGGGFTLPRYVLATRPGSEVRVLEVDSDLIDLNRTQLGLETGPDLAVVLGDARVTLRREPPDSADLVVGDAFGGRSIPWHLATTEFVSDIRRVLRPDGLYALNVIDYGALDLLRAEAATLLEQFADVGLIALPDADGSPSGGNLILLGSDRPLPEALERPSRGARFYDRAALERLAAGTDPLRDVDAPADQLLTPGI